MIVQTYDFVGDRSIPNSGDKNVMDRLNWFIDKYDRDCLNYVLGYDLYQVVLSPYVSGSPIDQLLTGTVYVDNNGNNIYWAGLKPMVLDYVYYYYMADDVATNTGKGVTIPKKDMAINISPAQKMIVAWNEFIKLSLDCIMFITSNSMFAYYPTYSLNYGRNIVSKSGTVNEFDI
jgi:hypothetical protein